MDDTSDFQQIAHSGGQVTFTVRTTPEGQRTYQIGWRHSRPNKTGIFAVYAIPPGVAVADLPMSGIGVPWPAPPLPDCLAVLIASDSEGLFGRQCPECSQYWRADGLCHVCPYCGAAPGGSYLFLTDAQQSYVHQYCATLVAALESAVDGDRLIDMDAVADAVEGDSELPPFYYAEERQQHLFSCAGCGHKTDVLGIFAYCSHCGRRNDVSEFENRLDIIRDRIGPQNPYEDAVRDAVASFDSLATHLAGQLRDRVPMTTARSSELAGFRFHNLTRSQELFERLFGIDILFGINSEDRRFLELMFHRRHVYEHRGGEVDEKYLQDSGDDARLKQALRETQESAHRTVGLVRKLGRNLDRGFHNIFPPLGA